MAAVVDDHRLLPRFRQGSLALGRRNAEIVLEAELAAERAGRPIGKPAPHDPVDSIRLRGIPCVGPGTAGGAIRGTRPDHAIMRLDK